MIAQPIHIILNPASAGGRTGRHRSRILRLIEERFPVFSLSITRGPRDATVSAAVAAAEGAELVLAVGGDGTIQEVVNGLLGNGDARTSVCDLAVLSSGTGCGFAQSLGIPRDVGDQVRYAANMSVRSIDVGRLCCTGFDGRLKTQYFVNECEIGIGGAVVQRAQQHHKRFGGLIAFGTATVQTALRHNNQAMTISADGKTLSGTFCGIAVANGAFTGGGMNLAPNALLDDHFLDLLVMHDLTVMERLRYFPTIYSGAHIHSRRFSYSRMFSVAIETKAPVPVAADGELLGTTPCTIVTVPSALRVRC